MDSRKRIESALRERITFLRNLEDESLIVTSSDDHSLTMKAITEALQLARHARNFHRFLKCVGLVEDIIEIYLSHGKIAKRQLIYSLVETFIALVTCDQTSVYCKMELLRIFNLILEGCSLKVAQELLKKDNLVISIENLFSQISLAGDFELQVMLIESLLRLLPQKAYRKSFFERMIPNARLCSGFHNIRDSHFDVDCRVFLNKFNEKENSPGDRIFSFPVENVKLDGEQIYKPEDEGYDEFWVDFNTGSKRISLFCQSTLLPSQLSQSREPRWETLSLRATDVHRYHCDAKHKYWMLSVELKVNAQMLTNKEPETQPHLFVCHVSQEYQLQTALEATLKVGKEKASVPQNVLFPKNRGSSVVQGNSIESTQKQPDSLKPASKFNPDLPLCDSQDNTCQKKCSIPVESLNIITSSISSTDGTRHISWQAIHNRINENKNKAKDKTNIGHKSVTSCEESLSNSSTAIKCSAVKTPAEIPIKNRMPRVSDFGEHNNDMDVTKNGKKSRNQQMKPKTNDNPKAVPLDLDLIKCRNQQIKPKTSENPEAMPSNIDVKKSSNHPMKAKTSENPKSVPLDVDLYQSPVTASGDYVCLGNTPGLHSSHDKKSTQTAPKGLDFSLPECQTSSKGSKSERKAAAEIDNSVRKTKERCVLESSSKSKAVLNTGSLLQQHESDPPAGKTRLRSGKKVMTPVVSFKAVATKARQTSKSGKETIHGPDISPNPQNDPQGRSKAVRNKSVKHVTEEKDADDEYSVESNTKATNINTECTTPTNDSQLNTNKNACSSFDEFKAPKAFNLAKSHGKNRKSKKEKQSKCLNPEQSQTNPMTKAVEQSNHFVATQSKDCFPMEDEDESITSTCGDKPTKQKDNQSTFAVSKQQARQQKDTLIKDAAKDSSYDDKLSKQTDTDGIFSVPKQQTKHVNVKLTDVHDDKFSKQKDTDGIFSVPKQQTKHVNVNLTDVHDDKLSKQKHNKSTFPSSKQQLIQQKDEQIKDVVKDLSNSNYKDRCDTVTESSSFEELYIEVDESNTRDEVEEQSPNFVCETQIDKSLDVPQDAINTSNSCTVTTSWDRISTIDENNVGQASLEELTSSKPLKLSNDTQTSSTVMGSYVFKKRDGNQIDKTYGIENINKESITLDRAKARNDLLIGKGNKKDLFEGKKGNTDSSEGEIDRENSTEQTGGKKDPIVGRRNKINSRAGKREKNNSSEGKRDRKDLFDRKTGNIDSIERKGEKENCLEGTSYENISSEGKRDRRNSREGNTNRKDQNQCALKNTQSVINDNTAGNNHQDCKIKQTAAHHRKNGPKENGKSSIKSTMAMQNKNNAVNLTSSKTQGSKAKTKTIPDSSPTITSSNDVLQHTGGGLFDSNPSSSVEERNCRKNLRTRNKNICYAECDSVNSSSVYHEKEKAVVSKKPAKRNNELHFDPDNISFLSQNLNNNSPTTDNTKTDKQNYHYEKQNSPLKNKGNSQNYRIWKSQEIKTTVTTVPIGDGSDPYNFDSECMTRLQDMNQFVPYKSNSIQVYNNHSSATFKPSQKDKHRNSKKLSESTHHFQQEFSSMSNMTTQVEFKNHIWKPNKNKMKDKENTSKKGVGKAVPAISKTMNRSCNQSTILTSDRNPYLSPDHEGMKNDKTPGYHLKKNETANNNEGGLVFPHLEDSIPCTPYDGSPGQPSLDARSKITELSWIAKKNTTPARRQRMRGKTYGQKYNVNDDVAKDMTTLLRSKPMDNYQHGTNSDKESVSDVSDKRVDDHTNLYQNKIRHNTPKTYNTLHNSFHPDLLAPDSPREIIERGTKAKATKGKGKKQTVSSVASAFSPGNLPLKSLYGKPKTPKRKLSFEVCSKPDKRSKSSQKSPSQKSHRQKSPSQTTVSSLGYSFGLSPCSWSKLSSEAGNSSNKKRKSGKESTLFKGFTSGPSSTTRLNKSALKRKYPCASSDSVKELSDIDSPTEENSPRLSRLLPKKLFDSSLSTISMQRDKRKDPSSSISHSIKVSDDKSSDAKSTSPPTSPPKRRKEDFSFVPSRKHSLERSNSNSRPASKSHAKKKMISTPKYLKRKSILKSPSSPGGSDNSSDKSALSSPEIARGGGGRDKHRKSNSFSRDKQRKSNSLDFQSSVTSLQFNLTNSPVNVSSPEPSQVISSFSEELPQASIDDLFPSTMDIIPLGVPDVEGSDGKELDCQEEEEEEEDDDDDFGGSYKALTDLINVGKANSTAPSLNSSVSDTAEHMLKSTSRIIKSSWSNGKGKRAKAIIEFDRCLRSVVHKTERFSKELKETELKTMLLLSQQMQKLKAHREFSEQSLESLKYACGDLMGEVEADHSNQDKVKTSVKSALKRDFDALAKGVKAKFEKTKISQAAAAEQRLPCAGVIVAENGETGQ